MVATYTVTVTEDRDGQGNGPVLATHTGQTFEQAREIQADAYPDAVGWVVEVAPHVAIDDPDATYAVVRIADDRVMWSGLHPATAAERFRMMRDGEFRVIPTPSSDRIRVTADGNYLGQARD